uniref:Photosystem I assembly protein Ycf4 n=1 Tax=Pectinodesmus pectinatus TaxID=91197 RepID=A0A2H4FHG7_9CHLO|nr:photosystem I assembly protein Ycf4 [Pectinodesmus pectinatus]AOS53109.1 photosystem I assembly protein Ycf4 [Pectinodesmus pectinatus]
MNQENFIRRYFIVGERRFSNYWWATIIFIGSFGFLFTGISSYISTSTSSLPVDSNVQNIIEFPFLTSILQNFQSNGNINFFPQGLLMCFYGSLGFLLSIYWWCLIFWNVGGGFNEFNKKESFIRIFRWGYPGKNRKIDLYYTLKDVESIRVEIQQGLDSQRTIFLKLKGNREIPITGIGQPLTLQEIEKQASELANFLQVSLEGL